MKADWFLSGLSKLETELSPDQLEVLEGEAASFQRAGGTLAWGEWAALSDASKVAWEKAGARVWSERCAAIACYLADPIEAVRVLKGEDAAVESALRAGVDPK